jgi:hypothetical protein
MTSGIDFMELLDRVKEGHRISDFELAAVRRALTMRTDDDPYTLLHILGKAGDVSYTPVIEKYLTYAIDDPLDDGMLRRLAVQILGQWWKLREVFNAVAKSAFDDPSEFVRAAAATALGDLGRAHPDIRAEAARMLLKGLDRYGAEDREVWGSFYEGALTLADIAMNKRPLRPGDLTPELLDKEVLAKLRDLASAG